MSKVIDWEAPPRKQHERHERPQRSANGEVALTKQSERDKCDVNKIMAKWQRTGVLEHLNPRTPLYGDFTNAQDLQTAIDRVRMAEERFLALPAEIRKRVNNNPVEFVEFVTNPENLPELIQLGLFPEPEKPKPEVPAEGPLEEATPPRGSVTQNS